MSSNGKLLIGVTTLILAACSTTSSSVYRSSNQQKTIGHGLSVSISNVATETEAEPFAEQYCKAQGRTPKFTNLERVSYHNVATTSAMFDCVLQSD